MFSQFNIDRLVRLEADNGGDFGSSRKRSFREIVENWETPEDALEYAESIGITKEQLATPSWLEKIAKLSHEEGGIDTNLQHLYKEINRRFKGTDKFKEWLGLEVVPAYTEIVRNWKVPKDAFKYAESLGITKKQLTTSSWLMTKAKLSSADGGINNDLSAFYIAIRQRFKSFDKFKKWLGVKVVLKFTEIVRSWETPEDAYHYAESIGITEEQLTSSSWLSKKAKLSEEEGGIGVDLNSLCVAIRQRFKTINDFKEWLGLEAKLKYTKIVRDWESSDDAFEFAENLGITSEQLANSCWLGEKAKLPHEEGGINTDLNGLYVAIRQRFNSFDKFKEWLGFEAVPNYREVVRSWESPKDALEYAASLGITKEQLTTPSWLSKKARLPHEEGGINTNLDALYQAVKKQFKSFDKFKEWLDIEIIPNYRELVRKWVSPEDALGYAESIGITKEQLTTSSWLEKKAKLPIDEGGVGTNLQPLYVAIRLRFKSFDKFKEWLGIEVSPNYEKIVLDWETPEDASQFAESLGITKEQLANSRWLQKVAKLPISEGGIGTDLQGLYKVIHQRFESVARFQEWLGIKSVQSTLGFLQDLFSSPEVHHLEALASSLGESAVAEFLAAKYQDRFQYNASTVENLRGYLGNFEVPSATTPADIPEGVLIIPKLSHLRDALFNHYRDSYQPIFSEKGFTGVRRELINARDNAELPEQVEFVQSLIDYFQEVNAIERPERLKSQIGGKGKYPANHQKIAVREMIEHKAILLADEMGGGKTGSSVAGYEHLRDLGLAHKALVVCPAQVMDVWKKALSDGEFGLYRKGEAPKVAFLGNGETDLSKIKDAEFVVASLEWTRGRNRKTGKTNEQLLKGLKADFFIFDESHNTKKAGGSDTERIFRISQTKSMREGHLVLLSGTPAPNKVGDIASQIRLLYAGRENVNIEGVDITNLSSLSRSLVRRSSPLLVRNLLVRRMLRRKTEDCLPVGSNFTKEIVTTRLSPYEQSLYNAIVEYPFYDATEKLLELRKMCLESESKYRATKSALNKALKRKKYQGSKKPPKVVIAESSYARGVTRDKNDIRWDDEHFGDETYYAARLSKDFEGKVKVFVLDGNNSHRRSQILKEFEEYDKPAVLLTLVPVVGEGLNISCASDGILISPTFNVSTEEQFYRRMFRRGQTQDVHLQVLQFPDTIEQGIDEYARRKHRVVTGLVDGRPLNAEERAILRDDYKKSKEKGPIAYETKTPREKALWILHKMYGKSKEEIRRLLSFEDGKYAHDFAEGFALSETTSHSGNNSRMVAGIINSVKPRRSVEIADIACGCRTLERMYEQNESVEVSSLDINKVALDAGAKLMQKRTRTRKSEVGTMDELPFNDSSKDIAVVSLALEYTCHSSNPKRGSAGRERINTLSELNRVLKRNGVGIISFQDQLFGNVTTFRKYCKTIERYFGFAIEAEHTGRVASVDSDTGHKFNGWVLTVRKVGEPDDKLNSPELYSNLMFPRKSSLSETETTVTRSRKPHIEKPGAYHDTFSIGQNEIVYRANTPHQKELKKKYDSDRKEEVRLGKRLKQLVKQHGSIAAIPENQLLSITPEVVSKSEQKERDLYFRALLEYYGDVAKVPIERISEESPVIIIRRNCKKKGDYLCLASINGSKGVGSYGSRYYHRRDLR